MGSEAERSSAPKQSVRVFQSRAFECSKAERSRDLCKMLQSSVRGFEVRF